MFCFLLLLLTTCEYSQQASLTFDSDVSSVGNHDNDAMHSDVGLVEKRTAIEENELGHPHFVFYGFTATVNAPKLHNLNPYETIIFDKVLTDVGKVFDQHRGTFTASVPGLYVFSVGAAAFCGNHNFLELVSDGKVEMTIHPDARSDISDSASGTTVLRLPKGASVWVRLGQEGNRTLCGDSQTVFAGWKSHG